MTRETDEVPSKYFYNILNARQAQSTITSLITDQGEIIEDQVEMLREARTFYDKLYTEEKEVSPNEQNFFLSKIQNTLSEEQKNLLENEITLQNLESALRDTETDKSPGYDGLSYEFYHTFWNLLKDDFLEVVIYTLYTKGELSPTQSRSVIILIHKKDGKRKLINWRPISLLCCDYKLISKALTNILKVLDTVLSNSQTASVPGRSIFNNLSYCETPSSTVNKNI